MLNNNLIFVFLLLIVHNLIILLKKMIKIVENLVCVLLWSITFYC